MGIDTIQIVEEKEVVFLEVCEQGPPGPQGPAGPAAGEGAAVVAFSIDSWVLNAGWYQADLTHSLEATILLVDFYEGNDTVWPRWEPLTTNVIRAFVPASPDSRFAGSAVILKVQ